MDEAQKAAAAFVDPPRLWSRTQCLSRPSPVPRAAGLYGWYFRRLPPGVVGTGPVQHDGCTLLYVGIAPSREFGANGLPSTSNLRSRIRTHFAGNAESSTLRLTLGTLLAEELGLLREVGGRSKSFGIGEHRLSAWMEENARVTWVEHPQPWAVEPSVIDDLDLPLNLAHNRKHPFWQTLTDARRHGGGQ